MGKLIDLDGLSEFKYKLLSLVGANSGIASLDSSGKVPSSQLPSYVDDVLEYSTKSNFPSTGETGKIYVDLQKNDTYRWSGSAYVQITNGSLDATLVSSSAVSGASTVEQALTSLNDNVTRSIYLELPVTLAVANWSSSSPYTYTVTDSRIDNAVGVEVEFNDGTSDTTAPYISYEKVSGGVQFTSTVKPTASIGVTIKLNQSKTEAYTDLTADMVASEAVPNTENVEEALTSLSDQIANYTQLNKGAGVKTELIACKVGRIVLLEIYGLNVTAGNYSALCTLPDAFKSLTDAIDVYVGDKHIRLVGMGTSSPTIYSYDLTFNDGNIHLHVPYIAATL